MRLNPQQVGRLIAAAGAKTLKRINLELRGKTSMIVFNDAPLASDPPGFGRRRYDLLPARPALHTGTAMRALYSP
jgi:hypothetical protein